MIFEKTTYKGFTIYEFPHCFYVFGFSYDNKFLSLEEARDEIDYELSF